MPPLSVQVGFDGDRFAVCFNGVYAPGIKNDCILMSGGSADRGDLAVLTRQIPTGSGVHKLLPNLKNAGQCVNVIPLKDSLRSDVSALTFLCLLPSVPFTMIPIISVVRLNKLSLGTLGHKQFWLSRPILDTKVWKW